MNISNLSSETLQKLVQLAISSSPTKAAFILLENASEPAVVSAGNAVINILQKPEPTSPIRTRAIATAFNNIYWHVRKGEKVKAIKEFRVLTGESLTTSVDTINFAFPEYYDEREGCTLDENNYWVRALKHYKNTQEILQD